MDISNGAVIIRDVFMNIVVLYVAVFLLLVFLVYFIGTIGIKLKQPLKDLDRCIYYKKDTINWIVHSKKS